MSFGGSGGGSSSIQGSTDVFLDNPANGNVLGYNSSTLKWNNNTLTKADVGLSNVDNTSDATKNSAAATLTNKTISGASNTLTNIPQSAVTNLTTDLSGKANTSHAHAAADITSGTVATARLGSGTANSTTFLRGDNTWAVPAGGGGGDASTNTATSVDSEVALFSGTGGKTLKRATGTGITKLTSGVLSTATAGTDYVAPATTITGATSLTGGGDLSANRTLSLVGDSASPGNNKYYGTNGSGTKGFYDTPSGTLPTQTGNSGKFLTTNGTAASWATVAGISPLYVNVMDYGATGDGTTDDTTAIETAMAVNGAIYFPTGNYVYNGSGLSHSTPRLLGSHKSRARILLGASSYLINQSVTMSSLNFENIDTVGGKGAIRHTFTGDNVNSIYTVRNCIFQGYTECAIAWDSSDMPYWTIENCKFDAADTLNTIGIATSGLSDMNTITRCMFIRNRVHIKVRNGGNNMHITHCDLIKFSSANTNGPRVDIWVVPWTNTVNGGQGFSMSRCKLGNEGIAAGDFRILYADELAGATNGVRFPDLANDSTGFIMGHQLDHFMINGKSGAAVPIVYSTTPNVRDLGLTHIEVAGTKPTYALEFRTPAGVVADRLNSQNLFGPFLGQLSTEGSAAFPISNVPGVGYVNDTNQAMQTLREMPVPSGSPRSASYSNLLTTAIGSFTVTNATKTADTDAFGGSEAQKIDFTTTSGVAFAGLGAMTVGKPVWVEFDLVAPSSGSAMSRVKVYVRDNGGDFHWVRTCEVPANSMGFKSYAFQFTPRTVGATPRLYFAHNGVDAVGAVVVGRPRVYHSYERVVIPGFIPVTLNARVASYTAVLEDAGKTVTLNSASGVNFTVPPNSSVAYPVGTEMQVVQLGAGQVTLVAGSGVTLNTPASLLARAQYSSLSLLKIATDTWIVGGDLQ